MYLSTKKYDIGLSCAFRQWKAKSHCNRIHGYDLNFRFVFGASTLDENNWVMDFGGLKPVKAYLERMFDHTTLVATDDPKKRWFIEGEELGVLDIRWVEATGCEKVAEMVFNWVDNWLKTSGHNPRVWLTLVEVSEHSGNSAIYEGESK